MDKIAPLKEVINQIRKEKGLKLSELLDRMNDVPQSNFSNAMSGTRRFTLKMVDEVTKALGLEPGSLYMEYIPECYNLKGKINLPKCIEFIEAASKLQYYQPINQLLNEILSSKNSEIRKIFLMAEQLYHLNCTKESLKIFKMIITEDRERDINNQRVLICYFRILNFASRVERMSILYEIHNRLRYIPDKIIKYENVFIEKREIFKEIFKYLKEESLWEETIHISDQIINEGITDIQDVLFYKIRAAREIKNYHLARKMFDEYKININSNDCSLREEWFKLKVETDLNHVTEYFAFLFNHPDRLEESYIYLMNLLIKRDEILLFERALSGAKNLHEKFLVEDNYYTCIYAEYLLRHRKEEGFFLLLNKFDKMIEKKDWRAYVYSALLFEKYRSLGNEHTFYSYLQNLEKVHT